LFFFIRIARLSADEYDGWTGDAGLIAMALLSYLSQTSSSTSTSTSTSTSNTPNSIHDKTSRLTVEQQQLMEAWIKALPNIQELKNQHPLLWTQSQQEILQYSSTKNIYKVLDDMEDDFTWWKEHVFDSHRDIFPPTVTLGCSTDDDDNNNNNIVPCFNMEGFTWAMAIVMSRAYFVEDALRLIPMLDMANHDPIGTVEIQCQTVGTLFGSTKAAVLNTGKNAYTTPNKKNKNDNNDKQPQQPQQQQEQVYVHYGPAKSGAEFLLDHGFVPSSIQTNTAEILLEIDTTDRFYEDKLDILELQQIGTSQIFDVSSRDEPDPQMLQFLRLVKLSDTDAFLLESIFRTDVWDFMAEPVSAINERAVVEYITELCQSLLDDMVDIDIDTTTTTTTKIKTTEDQNNHVNTNYCITVQKIEKQALQRTMEYMNREKEALDLKEYYQERRLKSLGLDSEYSDDENGILPGGGDDELGFGQSRAPGSLDW